MKPVERVLHPRFRTLYITRSKGLTEDVYIGTIILYHEPDMHSTHQWYLCLAPLDEECGHPIFNPDMVVKERWGSANDLKRISDIFEKPKPYPNCDKAQLEIFWKEWQRMEQQKRQRTLEKSQTEILSKPNSINQTEKEFYSRIDRTDNNTDGKKKKSIATRVLDKLFQP